MSRIRSVLIDNSVGSIFRNIRKVSQATAANVIAGNKLSTKSIKGSGNLRVANNVGNKGIFLLTGGVITQCVVSLKTQPMSGTVTIRFRVGETYATSVQIGELMTVPWRSPLLGPQRVPYLEVQNVTTVVPPRHYVYVDVVTIGSVGAGNGLTATVALYTG
jgi:hypothetical protein